MSASPSPSSSPILLLIDIQHGMVEGDPSWGPRSTPSLTANVSHLLSTWRSKSWPIIHVNHDDIYDDTNPISHLFPKTFAPHACAAPLDGEKMIVKHGGSAFVATELENVLKEYEKNGGKRKIVVAGMDGAQCINSTTRHGSDLRFEMVVVADACSTYGVPDWKDPDKVVDSETVHDIAMGMLAGDNKVTTCKKLMSILGY